jgi:hypothetical protein
MSSSIARPTIPLPLKTFRRQDDTSKGRWLPSAAFLAAASLFLASAVFYGFCLFPGLGGELNAGDSAKFQILGHTPIMVHGPGYPLVLLLGKLVRALALPLPPWWVLTFALSAVPAAFANAVAFLIVHRLTGSIAFGVAGALLLGSAGLMAVQATEAEVYALTLAFILTTIYLLLLFNETKRLGYFLSACAVYSLSFGNHLMMIMLLPLLVWLTIAHRRAILRPLPVAIVLLFILIGASQYLYLFYVAYNPETAYSEYMPLPPEPMEFVHYVLGTYFGNLYGSGLRTTRTLEALASTLKSAHPWVSMPMILVGISLFLFGWKRRDDSWRGIAIVYGAALSFLPFTLSYGAFDIQAFQLPVLGPLLVATVATLGWWLSPVFLNAVASILLVFGLLRAGQAAVYLNEREPIFAGLKPAIEAMVAQSPVEKPIVAMAYGLRMAGLYYEIRGELPRQAIYRLHWRALGEVRDQTLVGGIVVPTDGYQFVRWIEDRRPDMNCSTKKINLPEATTWPAYSFECRSEAARSGDSDTGKAPVPQVRKGHRFGS